MEGETELHMVQRHVQQGRTQITRQHEIIARLSIRSLPTIEAEELLATLETTQGLHEDHLARLEAKDGP